MTSEAVTIAGLFSTGVDATGAPLAAGTPDPHYVLTSTDDTRPGPNAPVLTANAAWATPTTTSRWIGAAADGIGAVAAYTYTTTFSLTGTSPTTATLTGTWACDDSCALILNGTQVASRAAPAYAATATFTVPAGTAAFVAGTNTLAFVTTNSGGGPTGLLVATLSGAVACTTDAVCAVGQFCNTQTGVCATKLANGTPIPTITGHTPVLNGMCSALVGAAVCVSAVCGSNNECGLANGQGPCVAAVTGSLVCQSGACSTNLTCEPAGGCNVDADCTTAQFCNTQTGACASKLANGTPIPTVTGHTPVLGGTCSAPVGAAVCVSAVCGSNNECGLANGQGPCVAAVTGSLVCQSGACSTNLTCEPAGGCNVDADCTGNKWCNETSHACTAKIANDSPVPTDAAHTNPTLNGTCTASAGALVCASGACDVADNKCGIADGDNGCTVGTAAVCRSGVCSVLGSCEPVGGCNGDGDCTAGHWCSESTHACVAQLPNGTLLPNDPPHTNPTLNGACNAAAATLVCQSGLCNGTSNTCVQCTQANATACTGPTLLCGPLGTCIPELDGGVDAGNLPDAGGLPDAGNVLDAGLDGGGPDAGGDAGARTDGGADSGARDAGVTADSGEGGTAGDDAGEANDATTAGGGDASSGTHNGGGSAAGELEGGGLSCAVSWARSSNSDESSGAPVLMLVIALGAAFGRGRRNR